MAILKKLRKELGVFSMHRLRSNFERGGAGKRELPRASESTAAAAATPSRLALHPNSSELSLCSDGRSDEAAHGKRVSLAPLPPSEIASEPITRVVVLEVAAPPAPLPAAATTSTAPLVGLALSYTEKSSSSDSASGVNRSLMHKVVSDALFDATVQRSAPSREIAEAFGLAPTFVDRNWIHTASSADLHAVHHRPAPARADVEQRIRSFARPVDASLLRDRLSCVGGARNDGGNDAGELVRDSSSSSRRTRPTTSRHDNAVPALSRLEVAIARHSDALSGGAHDGLFLAEVSVRRLLVGEACVALEVGDDTISFYSNGEVYLNGKYRTAVSGFASNDSLVLRLERVVDDLERTCSLVTNESECSVATRSAAAAAGRRAHCCLVLRKNHGMYYRSRELLYDGTRRVSLSVTYPTHAVVDVQDLVPATSGGTGDHNAAGEVEFVCSYETMDYSDCEQLSKPVCEPSSQYEAETARPPPAVPQRVATSVL